MTTPHERVFAAVAAIPAGCVASYGAIAAQAGLPGRARWVGRVLAAAPAEAALPWHRVLRADGHLAYAPGSAAFEAQRRRLEAEGVELVSGRVPRAHFARRQDLDRWLWAPRDAAETAAAPRADAARKPRRK
ncbi:MAG: MGMT family protein [Fulvimonas sp.]|nr:MGMT family protein [Fulvimonas sp.]